MTIWTLIGAVLLVCAVLLILSASVIITLCACWAFALALNGVRVAIEMWHARRTPPQWGDRLPLADDPDTADGAGRGLPPAHRSAP
jgi:hypothetical protein